MFYVNIDMIKLEPVTKINKDIIGIMDKIIKEGWNGAFVTIIISINNINDMIKFRNSDIIFPITKTYFGAEVLFKIFWLDLIMFIDAPTVPAKYPNTHRPDKRYTG